MWSYPYLPHESSLASSFFRKFKLCVLASPSDPFAKIMCGHMPYYNKETPQKLTLNNDPFSSWVFTCRF